VTDLTLTGQVDGDVPYRAGGVWTRLAKPAGAGRYQSHDGSVPFWRFGDWPADWTEPPAVASLTWLNQSPVGLSAASAAKIRGALVLSCDYRAAVSVSALLTTGTSLDVIFDWTTPSRQYAAVGMCWRESATGKMETVHIVAAQNQTITSWALNIEKWNSHTSWNGTRVGLGAIPPFSRVGLSLRKTGTNLQVFLLGQDALGAWTRPILSTSWAQTSFFTTGPDQVGLSINPQMGAGVTGDVTSLVCRHWVAS